LTKPADPTGSPDETRLSDVETRLAPAGGSRPDSSGRTTGWLSSSGSIDHGRFPPGTILGDRYRIVGKLGKGGMGEVYRADDLKLGQQVALKFLPPEVDRDPARLTQLHTEVRMARQVSHPNVCRVYDIDEEEGHTFLSMEYVDGEDLASLLRRIGHFPEARGLEIARQTCAGLAAAHERGVVHRDLKPANIMIDGTGRVRITDFGLAGIAGEALRAGTPAYMAPEQLAGGDVTARSDIYSLGLVLYEIFTGRRALEGANLAELIRRREQEEVPPPSALVRDLDPQIDRAVMRCLAPAPDARPASAMMVAAALPGGDPLAAALAAGETPSPEMVAAAGRTGAALSRRAGISLLLFAFAGLTALAILSDRQRLVGRVDFSRPAAVLEDRAQAVLRAASIPLPATDTARGVGIDQEYLTWIADNDQSLDRWDVLARDESPLLRYWYRTSPRLLTPLSPSWQPGLNDPPLALSGMASVVVDDKGRLLEFVSMPPQHDPDASADAAAVDWSPMFEFAGLSMADFAPVRAEWTPRIYAEDRAAWEGPMPGAADRTIRVEAASYGDRPVSFQIIWPWTRPVRMDLPTQQSGLSRALALAGSILVIALMAGAVLLVRYNLKSGRADRRGASRIALVLLAVWTASWALGGRHQYDVNAELQLFFSFFSSALLNTGFTWLFYLALEPFVRRFRPHILISWTRVLAGQVKDPQVARDLLVGVAAGLLMGLVFGVGTWTMSLLDAGAPRQPMASNVRYLLGAHHTISLLLQIVPNALQTSMVSTFFYVMFRAATGRDWPAIVAVVVLLGAVVMAEDGGGAPWIALLFGLAIAGPVLFVFLRFGLLSLATMLLVNQALSLVPLTTDLSRAHAGVSTLTALLVLALAVWAFRQSGAGDGLLRRFLPA
jgi:predicted Ser/Thr protein kinase